MPLTNEQKHQLNKINDHKNEICNSLSKIEFILKEYFPEEYAIAYQHWIPQIITALHDNDKWLPRGEQTLQKSIDRLLESQDIAKNNQSIKRYI